jgi:Na+/proline symporter
MYHVTAAAALMGQSGAIAMLILLFLAVTSACSAEQIAVSSLLTYDVYGTYINPHPSEKQILYSSHACILGYSLFMGAIAAAFNYIGVSMGYLYECKSLPSPPHILAEVIPCSNGHNHR